MKVILFFAFLTVGLQANADTRTVDRVNLAKYLGDWYEVASIPQVFAKGCHCSRARYGILADGTIAVLNTCNRGGTRGPFSEAKGVAEVVDKSTNAKLRVKFFGPMWGDYWIVGLDRAYRYAVVSNREGTSLWILSRKPQLSPRLYREALAKANSAGANVSELRTTVQRGCRYPR